MLPTHDALQDLLVLRVVLHVARTRTRAHVHDTTANGLPDGAKSLDDALGSVEVGLEHDLLGVPAADASVLAMFVTETETVTFEL